MKVATWNTQWAVPDNERGKRIRRRLAEAEADVIVVTEGCRGLLPTEGYTADAGADWGYRASASRRKAIVWSRYPLSEIVTVDNGAARGRLVTATAATQAGRIQVIGVCIPWASAHVNTGRSDAAPWSEHMNYLDQLESVLAEVRDSVPVIVAGDFNQRIPRVRQPTRVAARLAEVFNLLTLHTKGNQEVGPLIDHIAANSLLDCESVTTWPGSDHIGRLSDHSGVSCEFRTRAH